MCGRMKTTIENCQNIDALKIVIFLFYDKFFFVTSKRSAVKVFWPRSKLPLNRREPENNILLRY